MSTIRNYGKWVSVSLGLCLSASGLSLYGEKYGTPFFGDPPDAHHAWAVHDWNRPQPPVVEPADVIGQPPSDAIVLFNGKDVSIENWEHVKSKRKADWVVENGYLKCQAGAGYLATREEFGDCQLHIEWSHEGLLPRDGQGRGNSGVFLMGKAEIQILDNHQNPTYTDGMAGAVYGVMPPAANALRKPGEWQSYDIIFRRPIIKDGEVVDPGSMTVLVNGVVVQDSTPLEGGGGARKRKPLNEVFPEKGPLRLQDHGNPVRFRNIWYRPLRPRASEGSSDGRISAEAALEKRSEIAAEIRADAESMQGLEKALRLLESLYYKEDAGAREEGDRIAAHFGEELAGLDEGQLESQKGAIIQMYKALAYLKKHDLLSESLEPMTEHLDQIVTRNSWVKKRR